MRPDTLTFHVRALAFSTTCNLVRSSIVFPTEVVEREQRSLGAGSVSSKEFQQILWEGLRRIAEEGRGEK